MNGKIGRSKVGRPSGSKDISPIIRETFMTAAKAMDTDGGTTLLELMKESLRKNFHQTLKALSHFNPKEIVHNSKSLEEMTDAELDNLTSLAVTIVSERREESEDSGERTLN